MVSNLLSVGKSMSGGQIIIRPSPLAKFEPSHNSIIGNCALYGATGGVLFVSGLAGDRFAVRNSGALAVTEGTGLHACEYMTNGTVVILGPVSYNVGAGMTGGQIYMLKANERFVNKSYVGLGDIGEVESVFLKKIIEDFFSATESQSAKKILEDWSNSVKNFGRFLPVNVIKQIAAQRDTQAA